jgi:hypothetical protein
MHNFITGIVKVESDNAIISDSVNVFYTIKERFTSIEMLTDDLLEQNKALSCFNNRISKYYITDANYLAYLLDPRFRGERIINNELLFNRILNKLKNYGENIGIINCEDDKYKVKAALTSYMNKENLFGCDMLSDDNPKLFWKSFQSFKNYEKLAVIAKRLMSMPVSSASVERSFSSQNLMHTEIRNKLNIMIKLKN